MRARSESLEAPGCGRSKKISKTRGADRSAREAARLSLAPLLLLAILGSGRCSPKISRRRCTMMSRALDPDVRVEVVVA